MRAVIPLLLLAGWTALGMAGCASRSGTQGAEAGNGGLPSFETASIKPDKLRKPLAAGQLLPGMPTAGVRLSGGDFTATTIVSAMIMDAYGQPTRWLNPNQVSGGPAWIWTDFYQINAKVSDSVFTGEWKKLSREQRMQQALLMLRSLLINRFKLRIRHETKVLPVLELVVAKNGPKFSEDKTAGQPCRLGPPGPGKQLGLSVESCGLSTFTGVLSLARPDLGGRMLLDKTGLHGRYSFKLYWEAEMPPEMPAKAGQANPGAAPSKSLETALQKQLGLKLVPAKAPVDVIVVEHIERPSEN